MVKEPEQVLEDNGYDVEALGEEGTMLFRNPDFSSAIIGISSTNHVVYDYEKMIDHLMIHEEFTEEEAIDWVEYNTLRTYSSEGLMPIIMYPFKQD